MIYRLANLGICKSLQFQAATIILYWKSARSQPANPWARRVERSRLRSYHPRVVWIYIKRWFQRGEFYDSHGDDTTQLGGDFIVDKNGILRLVYPSHDPVDRLPVDELLKVLKTL